MGVLTGAIAIVKQNGIVIGKMRGITVTENIQRSEVRGLGSLVPDEVPATIWSGTLRCQFYNIDFSKSQVPNAIVRTVQTIEEFEDTVTLNEEGISVDIYKRVQDVVDPVTKVIKSKEQPYAQINNIFIDSEDFDIMEGQVSGRNQSFRYISPIIYPS